MDPTVAELKLGVTIEPSETTTTAATTTTDASELIDDQTTNSTSVDTTESLTPSDDSRDGANTVTINTSTPTSDSTPDDAPVVSIPVALPVTSVSDLTDDPEIIPHPNVTIPVAQPIESNTQTEGTTLTSTTPANDKEGTTTAPPVATPPAADASTDPTPIPTSDPAPASAPAPAPEPAKSGWSWWGWGKKKADPPPPAAEATPPQPAPTTTQDAHPAPASSPPPNETPEEREHRESMRMIEAAESKLRASQDAAFAAAAAHRAEESKKDHLGGTRHPWLHSVVRYSINKIFGFQTWEEGMEERYRDVLCRELVTMALDMNDDTTKANGGEGGEDDVPTPQLSLEMSHFYPNGCHNTPLPVILMRTPYDRAMMRHTAERICQHGYHVIVQDTRNSPNRAALEAKKALAAMAAAKAKKLVEQEANAIRQRYLAKSPKTPKRPPTMVDGQTLPPTLDINLIAPSPTLKPTSIDNQTQQQQEIPIRNLANEFDDVTPPTPAVTIEVPSSSSSSATATASASSTLSPGSSQPPSLDSPRSADGSIVNAPTPSSSHLPNLTPSPQEFFPIVHESHDGHATIDWISKQPWCDGNVSFYGASYLGIAQYAVVDHQHPALKCIVPVASASRVFNILFPEPGTLNLDLAARWLFIMFSPSVTGSDPSNGNEFQPTPVGHEMTPPGFWKRSYARVIGSRSVIPKAVQHLPACELDQCVTEKKLGFYQEMIQHAQNEDASFWKEKQVKLCNLINAPPLLIVEGWYDLFLHQALRDYVEALEIYKSHQADVAAGKYTPEELAKMKPSIKTFRPYLTIINCVHIDFKQLYRISLEESIQWFDFHMKPDKSHRLIDRPAERSVRVQMINASGPNEARHLGLIAKRKKILSTTTPTTAAATSSSSSSTGQLGVDSDLSNLHLLSPRSKVRVRQTLIDAQWRYFSEFPPPQARSVKWYLYCDVQTDGREVRTLRLEEHGAREELAKRREEERMAAMVAVITQPTTDGATTNTADDNPTATASDTSTVAPAAAAPAPTEAPVPSVSASSSIPSIPPSVVPAPLAPILPNLSFSCYSYDPRDPTPSIGGTGFDVENSGPLDCRPMEARSDVIVFTSEPLTQPLTVIGFVHCMLYVRSNVPCTDFIGRLCDVYPIDEWSSSSDRKTGSGKSQILCDGLFKVTPTKIDQLTVEKGIETIKSPTRPVRTISVEKPAEYIDVQIRPATIHTPNGGEEDGTCDLVTLNLVPTAIVTSTDFEHPFFPISAPDTTTPLIKIDIDMVTQKYKNNKEGGAIWE